MPQVSVVDKGVAAAGGHPPGVLAGLQPAHQVGVAGVAEDRPADGGRVEVAT